jgi:hypothetical protein
VRNGDIVSGEWRKPVMENVEGNFNALKMNHTEDEGKT